MGRRQAARHERHHDALVSGRRGAGPRSLHRGEDGRGQHTRLSRYGLCRVRRPAARRFRQPHSAALLRGLPSARRSRHRRGTDARGHHDPGLGRVHLCHAGNPQDHGRCLRRHERRYHHRREPERAAGHRRHRRGARPASGHGACGREGQPRRRLVRHRPARGQLPGQAWRRGSSESHDPAGVVGERRGPIGRASGQSRQRGPPGLWRHALRLRRGAGNPGNDGARAPRHLLSLHSDGCAARQQPAQPLQRQRRPDRTAGIPLARAHHLFASGRVRGHGRQDRHGRHAGLRVLRRGYTSEFLGLGRKRQLDRPRGRLGVCAG